MWRLLVASLALLFLVASCGEDSSDDATLRQPYDTQIDEPIVAGGYGPRYEEPITVTDGDYYPANFPFEEISNRLVENTVDIEPVFSGEVAGIQLVPFGESAQREEESGCAVTSFPLGEHLAFSYLPPGTSLETPQFEATCGDKTLVFVAQSFLTKRGSFHVQYEVGYGVLRWDAAADRVREATVGDSQVLIVDPPAEEGLGASMAAIRTDSGLIFIAANNLPVTEITQILGGIKCGDC